MDLTQAFRGVKKVKFVFGPNESTISDPDCVASGCRGCRDCKWREENISINPSAESIVDLLPMATSGDTTTHYEIYGLESLQIGLTEEDTLTWRRVRHRTDGPTQEEIQQMMRNAILKGLHIDELIDAPSDETAPVPEDVNVRIFTWDDYVRSEKKGELSEKEEAWLADSGKTGSEIDWVGSRKDEIYKMGKFPSVLEQGIIAEEPGRVDQRGKVSGRRRQLRGLEANDQFGDYYEEPEYHFQYGDLM